MRIVPSIAVRAGQVVRPSPFFTADAVFAGTPAAVAARFLARTTARLFHLVDVDGAAGTEASIAAAQAVRALAPGVSVMLEGGLVDLDAARAVVSAGLVPIVEATVLEGRDQDPVPTVLFALRGDDEGARERAAQALELGLWGIVHYSADPSLTCALGRMLGPQMPFFSREPPASPDTVEEVIGHHRQLYRGGVPGVIVDGEWYVDYNTMNAPFDLLAPAG